MEDKKLLLTTLKVGDADYFKHLLGRGSTKQFHTAEVAKILC
jgi:hypothetical protein